MSRSLRKVLEVRERLAVLACVCLALAGQAWAEASPVAAFAAKNEARMKERVEAAKLPRARVEMEYLMRQDYTIRLERERVRLLRSGALTTPEVERLRAERKALLRQIEDLDKRIEAASEQAPEIVELDAVRAANKERIEALRDQLLPPSAREGATPAAEAGATDKEKASGESHVAD